MLDSNTASTLWLRVMPLLFIVLWSTGFIGAKFGLPYAEPFTFLAVRLVIAAFILGIFTWLMGISWPQRWSIAGHIAVAGILVHALHLGGVFSSIHAGLPAGVAALIMGLQPLLTATVAGRLLGERVTARQWLGLLLGLVGIGLVLYNRMGVGVISAKGVAFAVMGLCALTLGTIYQKRFCAHMDPRSGGVIQCAAASVVLIVLAFLTETREIVWSGEFIFALSWLTLVLSVGAFGLLYTLIRLGAASKVASLFYLSPPFAVLFAFLLFDEVLGVTALIGMVIAMLGVVLVNAVRGEIAGKLL